MHKDFGIPVGEYHDDVDYFFRRVSECQVNPEEQPSITLFMLIFFNYFLDEKKPREIKKYQTFCQILQKSEFFKNLYKIQFCSQKILAEEAFTLINTHFKDLYSEVVECKGFMPNGLTKLAESEGFSYSKLINQFNQFLFM